MDQDQREYEAQVELIRLWAAKQFTVTDPTSLHYRLSGRYELFVSNGKPVGNKYTGLWTIRAFHCGQPLHTTDSLRTIWPSDHFDAARSAVVMLKANGLMSVDAVEA